METSNYTKKGANVESNNIHKSRLSSYIHINNWNEQADGSKFEKRLAIIIIEYK